MLRYTNIAFGLFLLAFGVATWANPHIVTSVYGIALPTHTARAAIAGIFGGAEITLALLFFRPSLFAATHATANRIGIGLLLGLITARLSYGIVHGAVTASMFRESLAELGLAIILLASSKR